MILLRVVHGHEQLLRARGARGRGKREGGERERSGRGTSRSSHDDAGSAARAWSSSRRACGTSALSG